MSLSLDNDPLSGRFAQSILGRSPINKRFYRKSYRQVKPNRLTLRTKKYLITALTALNVLLLVLTMQRGQAAQLSDLHAVQALIAPPVVAQEAVIHPVKAPAALEASVKTEVVAPVATPVTMVAAASIARVSTPSSGGWDSLLQHYFGAAWQEAKRVMLCESGGNPTAYNRSGATGLMQIMAMPGRPSIAWLMVPENNIAYAAQLYRSSGWAPWVCKPW